MGNSAGGLLYDIGSSIEYNNNNFWQLNEGSKKGLDENQKETVAIFRLSKKSQPDRIPMAQRCIQKLRALKHPNVVTFIETAEVEDSIVLVTETVLPLEVWLQRTAAESKTFENKSTLVQEVIWGFRCIIQALQFIHVNGSMIHGNLGLHAIFVMPGGDWKLGALELAANMMTYEDYDYFTRFHHILNKPYASPERQTLRVGDSVHNDSILKAQLPPYYLDIYSFGQCIQSVFNALDLDVPSNLSKYLTLMMHTEIKKRPSAVKLAQSAVFNSDYIKLLESINDLSLKSPKEAVEVIGQLEPKIVELSKAMCAYKILPNVCRTLQMAINDFPNRDAREACRLNVQVSVNLLASMASMNKLDEAIFRRNCVPIIVQLWPMTDRSVRTVLLQSLKSLADVIPSTVVNKTIFDNIVAGFSDSNAKLRESTLMSLIFIVDKLDDVILQDRLVRCVVNLQNDGEASIRTNATIFLGKIAGKLKEPVRVRVLANAFSKAMKDNFLHCRLAGLKTSTACVKLLDVPQMTMKIVPTAAALLLDKSSEVRSQAFVLIEACLDILKSHHNAMTKAAAGDKFQPDGTVGSGSSTKTGGGSSGTGVAEGSSIPGAADAGWSSWSMLQGLSKTLESATISATGGSTGSTPTYIAATVPSAVKGSSDDWKMTQNRQSSASFASAGSEGGLSKNNSLNQVNSSHQEYGRGKSGSGGITDKNCDYTGDFNSEGVNNDDDWGNDSFSNNYTNSGGGGANKWDDDEINFDDFGSSAPSSPAVDVKKTSSNGGGMKLSGPAISVPKATIGAAEEGESGVSKLSAKKNKVLVKKLDVSKDNWDDF